MQVVVLTFTTMNSYWVPHAGSENHCETRKSLKICDIFHIYQQQVYCTKILDVDELKRCISNKWTTLSVECADAECTF